MTTNNYQIPCQKIISGGQTGVDRGALDAALQSNFACGGWCPKGRKAEDGKIDTIYPLAETTSSEYAVRTKKNIDESDGTLIISADDLTGGTELTFKHSKNRDKPVLVINPLHAPIQHYGSGIIDWIVQNDIKTLNIAGPRKSEWPEGYAYSFQVTSYLIYEINKSYP